VRHIIDTSLWTSGIWPRIGIRRAKVSRLRRSLLFFKTFPRRCRGLPCRRASGAGYRIGEASGHLQSLLQRFREIVSGGEWGSPCLRDSVVDVLLGTLKPCPFKNGHKQNLRKKRIGWNRHQVSQRTLTGGNGNGLAHGLHFPQLLRVEPLERFNFLKGEKLVGTRPHPFQSE